MRLRAVAVAALLIAACALAAMLASGLGGNEGPASPIAIRSAAGPLREGREELARNGGPLTVRAMAMDTRDGGVMSGYVVRARRRTHAAPAVVLLHGRGTDASDLVLEGALLAERGAVAVIPDNAYVRLGPVRTDGRSGLRRERRRRLASAADLADVVVALGGRDDVDPTRIAVAGYSLGGYVASLVAAHLPLAAEVYVATGAEWLRDPALAHDPRALATTAELDPVAAIGRAPAGRPRLIQLGERDAVIGLDRLECFARAVPEPKRVLRYDAGHTLDVGSVSDRIDWLSARLGLGAA